MKVTKANEGTILGGPIAIWPIAQTAENRNWLYQPSLGLFNQILMLLEMPTLSYLRSPDQALPSIVVYALWKNVIITIARA